jgi:hypothetical protein
MLLQQKSKFVRHYHKQLVHFSYHQELISCSATPCSVYHVYARVWISSVTNNTIVIEPSGTMQGQLLKSGTVLEIQGQLEPMPIVWRHWDILLTIEQPLTFWLWDAPKVVLRGEMAMLSTQVITGWYSSLLCYVPSSNLLFYGCEVIVVVYTSMMKPISLASQTAPTRSI